MKKLILVLAVAFGASMVACSNANSDANAEGQDSAVVEEVAVEEVVAPADSAAADSVAPAAADSTAAAPAEEAK